jgi:hypothetical protein
MHERTGINNTLASAAIYTIYTQNKTNDKLKHTWHMDLIYAFTDKLEVKLLVLVLGSHVME